jgi:hypothetical protein
MLCGYKKQSNGGVVPILTFEQSAQIFTEGAHCNQSIRTQVQMDNNVIDYDL